MMAKRLDDLTVSELKYYLTYDPETGLFYWNEKAAYNTVVGSVAGSLNSKGYLTVTICYKSYLLHRLAWLYMTGEWPEDEIDHDDTDTQNNKWKNLREATRYENTRNSKIRITNKSGLKGVHWDKRKNKFVSQIMANRKKIHLGYFSDKEEAHKAYCEASTKFHMEFSNHG